MATTSNLELLRRLRDAVSRSYELELADLERQIKAQERAKPVSHTLQLAGREHTHALLKIMQQAKEPLPPRELARRLESDPRTVSRWLAAAKRQGYVERVDGARYQVRKEVPPLD
jgi:predicted Rossmann fold nucleotide-binding protein DprA/Smf involved in DNA uptake